MERSEIFAQEPCEWHQEETSRPHPFAEPGERRLTRPRWVGRAHPARRPPAPRAKSRAPAHPPPARARAQGAGARSGLPARAPAPLTRLAAAVTGGDATGRGAGEPGSLGSRGGVASPTFALSPSEVTARRGASGHTRTDTRGRPRNLIPRGRPRPDAGPALQRPLPPRAPHLRRPGLRRKRGPGRPGCVTPAAGGAGAPRPIRGRGPASGPGL